jgi:hypothetical protein
MLSQDKQRLALLVAEGVSYQIIASVCGISAGRISQLIEEDEELQGYIAKEHAANLQVTRARTAKMEEGIDALLDVIPGLVTECTNVGEAVRSLAQLTQLQQQARGWDRLGGQQGGVGGGLTLHLSVIAEQQLNIQVDGQQRIVAVDGQTVRPMSKQGVEDLFGQQRKGVAYLQDEIEVPKNAYLRQYQPVPATDAAEEYEECQLD